MNLHEACQLLLKNAIRDLGENLMGLSKLDLLADNLTNYSLEELRQVLIDLEENK